MDSLFSLRISPDDQRAFAVWATLRIMIFDSMADPRRQYYTQAERVAFRSARALAPPPNTHIWVCQFVGSAQARFKIVSQVDVSKDWGVYLATFVINKMAVVFATWKGSEQEIDTAAMARDGWTHLTRQVWPSKRRHLKWPPMEPVTDETFTTFEAMLKPPTVAVSDAD